MSSKILIFVLILIIVLLIGNVIAKQSEKEDFQVYKLSTEKIEDLNKIKTSRNKNKNIFVGETKSRKENDIINLGTDNTIFIKDGIELKGGSYLDIYTLRSIKSLPFNFKDKICIGRSCINKKHLKMLKGEIPLKINTFYNTQPYQLYGGTGFGRIKTTVGVGRGFSRFSFPIYSIRITESDYQLIIFSEPNFRGQSLVVQGAVPNVKRFKIDGKLPFVGGVKSFIPRLKSGIQHAKNRCLSLELIHQLPSYQHFYQPKDCNKPSLPNGNEFYILRDDAFDSKPRQHFHDHSKASEFHDSQHRD